MDANDIIDLLGGTSEVAKLCEVRAPSVSEWRRNGIPPARLLYLRAVRPDVFAGISREPVTAGAVIEHAIGAPNVPVGFDPAG
jgi:hypothetical protein